MGYWFGGMWWWMALAGIFCVLFWGGIIWLVAWGINKATGHKDTAAAINSPLEIAKQRYAKSEITREQFEQIKKDLT
ncbi:MAG: SHOCT domain-containing protein [Dehalococcoidia bacterium]|nr:SHOCT domain-containing protein [Dehalococcoidia bacterium]